MKSGHTQKCIIIRSDQAEFIDEASLNLSSFVRKMLDKKMKKEKKN